MARAGAAAALRGRRGRPWSPGRTRSPGRRLRPALAGHADDRRSTSGVGPLGERRCARVQRRAARAAAAWRDLPAEERGAAGHAATAAGGAGPPHGGGAAAGLARPAQPAAGARPAPRTSRSPASSSPSARSAATTTTSCRSGRTGWRFAHRRRDGQGRARRPARREPEGLGARAAAGRASARARTLWSRASTGMFWEVAPSGLFASLFFAVFDLEGAVLDYVNAGHHYPFLVRPRRRRSRDLDEGGTVLGLVEEARATSRARSASQPGDLLVFYSDGVTDRGERRGRAVRRRAAEGGGAPQPGATRPVSPSTRCSGRCRAGRRAARRGRHDPDRGQGPIVPA